MTQTTPSVDDAAAIIALKVRFPSIIGPKKGHYPRYATQNRQMPEGVGAADRRRAGGGLAQQLELQPAARGRAARVWRLHGRQAPTSIRSGWRASLLGVTGRCLRPVLVRELVERLSWVPPMLEVDGISENVVFPLPEQSRGGPSNAGKDA